MANSGNLTHWGPEPGFQNRKRTIETKIFVWYIFKITSLNAKVLHFCCNDEP